MMKFMPQVLILLFVFTSGLVNAKAEQLVVSGGDKAPFILVENTTQRIMGIIAEAQGYFDDDPDRFYREITIVLDEFVDFKSFARGVMGKYASKKRYQSLATKEEKDKLKQQVVKFRKVFHASLVQTYAKGLLAFNGNKAEVLPANENSKDGKGAITVTQHVHGKAKKPYVVNYKMRRNRAGEWKVRNVTIEAINLGKVYQSQFYSAVKQHNGDIDQVIENWRVDPNGANSS